MKCTQDFLFSEIRRELFVRRTECWMWCWCELWVQVFRESWELIRENYTRDYLEKFRNETRELIRNYSDTSELFTIAQGFYQDFLACLLSFQSSGEFWKYFEKFRCDWSSAKSGFELFTSNSSALKWMKLNWRMHKWNEMKRWNETRWNERKLRRS
jgi:hypothetical protein